MKHILFVDDEPMILQGLQNLLRKQRRKWNMVFAEGGEQALSKLAERHFDVIVSDMRMPGIDGATLLKKVQKDYPHMVRIVLSGHAEMEAALRAIPVSHQFLSKPCDSGNLEDAIERACDLKALIDDEQVLRTIGQIDKLPSVPHVYMAVTNALRDEDVSPRELASILRQDMAMCAKLLQLVNSSYFRLSREITRVDEAVNYLGFNMVRSLVLSVELFSAAAARFEGFSIESLQQHCLLTGSIASRIVSDPKKCEEAFMAGMLHDIGKLVLAKDLPEHFREVLSRVRESGDAMFVVEQKLAGVTHAEVGAYLLGIWGLPYPIVEAVANHHQPGRVRSHEPGVLTAVHVADALANEHGATDGASKDIDEAYLESLELGGDIGKWREIAAEQARLIGAHEGTCVGGRT